MKKLLKLSLILIVILFVLLILMEKVIFTETNIISNKVGLDISGQVTESFDSHGGFLGDGTKYVQIALDNYEDLEKQLSQAYNWKALPLDPKLREKLLGDSYEANIVDIVLYPNNESKEIKVENGFYYFNDRYEGDFAGDYYSNYDICVIDSDKEILHYMESDM